jgi:hypothetical protein
LALPTLRLLGWRGHGIHFTAEHAVGWIPGSRHPSRLLPTWTIHIAELG